MGGDIVLWMLGLLVLLIVPVIGQWLGFHDGQHGYQVAGDAAALAPDQFRDIRIFLLRHDGGTGAVTIRQLNEIKLRRCPQHQFL